MSDLMCEGYKKGKEDCRKGIKVKESYHSDSVYAIGYSTGWDSEEYHGRYGVDKPKPQLFAVIEVDLDYDYINGLECIKTFPTEEEAQKFINNAREARNNYYQIRENYIKEYIKSIEFNDIDNHEDWLKFLSQFPGIDTMMTHKANFHSKLRDYINNRYTPPGFNPPDIITFGTCLHIVEIKDC